MKMGEVIYAGFFISVCIIFYLLKVMFDIPAYFGVIAVVVGILLLISGSKRMEKEDKGEVKDWPWSKK